MVENIIYPMLMKKTVWLFFLAGSRPPRAANKKRVAVHLSCEVGVSVGWRIQGQCILITALMNIVFALKREVGEALSLGSMCSALE